MEKHIKVFVYFVFTFVYKQIVAFKSLSNEINAMSFKLAVPEGSVVRRNCTL